MKKILSISAIFVLTIVLFACQKETFIVSYNLDGGIGLINDEEVAKNKLATKPTIEPTKEGFDFIYWEYLGEEFDFKTPIVQNITLTAKWDNEKFPDINYLVTFDSNGGTDVDEVEVPHGFLVSKPEAPTKDNMIFIGWYLDDVEFDFQTKILGPITLVAKWEEIANPGEKFTVTFESNGGTNVPSQKVDSGEKINLTNIPTKEGYGLVGWYLNEDLSGDIFSLETPITDNIKLYAKWAKLVTERLEPNKNYSTGNLNMLDDNDNAKHLSLEENYFKVDAIKGATENVGYYTELRFYNNSGFTLTINESFVIYGLKFQSNPGLSVLVDGSEIELYESNLNTNVVTIRNLTTTQHRTKYIDILYYQVGEPVLKASEINSPKFDKDQKNLYELTVGDTFEDINITTTDVEDGIIEANKDDLRTDFINAEKSGIYYIHFYAEDNDGNRTNFYITIIVREVDAIESYYESINDESGDELQELLSTLLRLSITNDLVKDYGKAKDVLPISDRHPDNFDRVLLIYSSETISGPWDSRSPNYEREHVWAKSALGQSNDGYVHSIISAKDGAGKKFDDSYIGASSDLQNLRAINGSVNSSHNNFEFSENSTSIFGRFTVSKRDLNPYTPGQEDKTTTSGYEPGLAHRGDVARILLYMMLMWDITPREDISMLVNWHNLDPVDNFEIIRNEVIYSYQGNRNPFIDYPNLVEKAFLVN